VAGTLQHVIVVRERSHWDRAFALVQGPHGRSLGERGSHPEQTILAPACARVLTTSATGSCRRREPEDRGHVPTEGQGAVNRKYILSGTKVTNMHQRSILTRAVSAFLLTLTACRDLPTVTPATQPPVATRTASAGLHTGQVQFFCVLGRRAPSTASGWQTRIDTVFFPRAELDEGGRKVVLQFWQPGVDGKMQSGAHCVVPYTEAALRRVDRFFGVEKNGAADQFRARQGMITTQGCVSDGMCVLDPLVVVAPPPEPTDFPPCSGCDAPYPGPPIPGGDGGTGGGGSGGSGDAYSEGPGAFALCVGALAGVMIGTATLKMYMDAVYTTAGAVDSERRMLDALLQNGGSPEMIQLYQTRWENARSRYNGAITNLAIASGGSALTLIAAVGACSPALLLPTP